MKLEVGKTYRTRAGDMTVTIMEKSDADYPFSGVGTDGRIRTYTEDGSHILGLEDGKDLVELAHPFATPEEGPALQSFGEIYQEVYGSPVERLRSVVAAAEALRAAQRSYLNGRTALKGIAVGAAAEALDEELKAAKEYMDEA